VLSKAFAPLIGKKMDILIFALHWLVTMVHEKALDAFVMVVLEYLFRMLFGYLLSKK
jgi:hypothetical protein